MHRISDQLREFWVTRLTCRGCERETTLGLDDMLRMSKQNDDWLWWRERFKCETCGAKNPYFAKVSTHLTSKPVTNGAYWDPNSKFGI